MSSAPALPRIFCALGGVVAGITWGPGTPSVALTALAICGFVAVSLRRRRAIALVGLVLAAASCGAVAAGRARPVALEGLARAVPACKASGRLLEHAGGLGSLVAIDELRCERHPAHGLTGVVVVDSLEADPGTTLTLSGWLLPLKSDDRFDRARRRLGAHAGYEATAVQETRPPGGLHGIAAAIRAGLERSSGNMDPERAGLLSGLVTGDTDGMGRESEELLRRAGLSHLVAVSGSNVAIVVGATALVSTGLALRARLALCGLALGLYVLVVGPEPSVLRAAAMGGIGLLALAAGRRAEPLHALGIALIVVLTLRPGLVFSVGLHLSAAATAGIVLFASRLARRMEWMPRPVALALAVTLSAQAAVIPVLVGTFGEFSVVSPLANVLAAPAVAPPTVLGLVAAIVGVFAPTLGSVCARLGEPFVAWILAVGTTTGAWSWASVEVAGWWAWPLAAAVATAGVLALRRPQPLAAATPDG